MLIFGAIHLFELLCNPSSPNILFLWRLLVRDHLSGHDHFASTWLRFIDHLEYLHLFQCIFALQFLTWLTNRIGIIPFLASLATISSPSSSTLSSTIRSMSWLFSSPISFMAHCKRRRMLSTIEMADVNGPDRLSRMIVS